MRGFCRYCSERHGGPEPTVLAILLLSGLLVLALNW
jgi:hypothetical protein